MQYSTKIHDKYAIFTPGEEKITSSVAPEFKSQLLILNQQGKVNIIMDLSAVKYMDSSGLSALLRAHKFCKEDGGILVLTNIQEHVQKLIKISMLQNTLNIFATNQEGIERVFMHEIEREITPEEESEEAEVDEFGSAASKAD